MVEVIKKGAYLVDGQIVYADQAQNVPPPTKPAKRPLLTPSCVLTTRARIPRRCRSSLTL